ncbi:MAG: hypothetical protein RIC80_17535 [Cyclobacteriaceae bacterium]
MGKTDLKSNLHQLIDSIQNQELLQSIYDILDARKEKASGGIWSNLTDDQRNEVLEAFEESEKEENLVPHAQVVKELK